MHTAQILIIFYSYHFYSRYRSFRGRNQQNLIHHLHLFLVSSLNPRCLVKHCAGAFVVRFQMTFFDSRSKICSHLKFACLTVHTPTQTGHCSLFTMLENHVWTCALRKKSCGRSGKVRISSVRPAAWFLLTHTQNRCSVVLKIRTGSCQFPRAMQFFSYSVLGVGWQHGLAT